jgi:nucleoside-diphosphate-sugar epimerase
VGLSGSLRAIAAGRNDAILVTGCAGFIGHAVVRAWLARGERIVGLDNLNADYDPALKQARLVECAASRFTFLPIDLCDREALDRLFGVHKPTGSFTLPLGVRYSPSKIRAPTSTAISPVSSYNLGNSHPEPLLRFIEVLERAIGRTAQRVLRPMQAGDVRSTAADIELTARELNWQPTTSVEDGVPRLVN